MNKLESTTVISQYSTIRPPVMSISYGCTLVGEKCTYTMRSLDLCVCMCMCVSVCVWVCVSVYVSVCECVKDDNLDFQ